MPKKSSFFNFLRMSPKRMEHRLSLFAPLITNKDTNFRKAILPAERLMLTLRFLASGDSQISLTYLYCMGKKTVSRVISETCEALYEVLCSKYFNTPKTGSNGKMYPTTSKSYGSFYTLSEQSMGRTFVFWLQIKMELCFIIAKDFSAFNYLQFGMLSTILYWLMLDNMDLTIIVLFLQIQMYQTYPWLTKSKVSKRMYRNFYGDRKYFH